MGAWVTIQLLQRVEGEITTRIVSLKRQEIDTDLLSLSGYLDEISAATNWPAEVRIVVEMKSSNMKEFMCPGDSKSREGR